MSQISECEVVQEEPLSLSSGTQSNAESVIEASDVGSLLEQFMEYEKGSDVDFNSYPNSSFITPCGSPSESEENQQTVLGRLMIVQEKLSQGVEDSSVYTPNSSQKDDVNANSIRFPQNKLLRTIDGIHPKGDNIRMADSPKFAKFKRKRATNIPPARRCFSGTTTPRATSPSDIVTPEEKKRREAKLIEALALPFPSVNKGKTPATVKRNLSETNKKKKELSEHIPSRLMPVVSKRKKYNTQNRPVINSNGVVDPRRCIEHYGKHSNISNLVDTNIGGNANGDHDDDVTNEKDNDKAIVDMTIDHDAIAGTILVAKTSEKRADDILPNNEQTIPQNENVNNTCNVDVVHDNENTDMSLDTTTVNAIVPNDVATLKNGDASTLQNDDVCTVQNGNKNTLEIVDGNTSINRPLKRKQPKNYRKNNNFEPFEGNESSSSCSSSSHHDNKHRKKKKKRKHSDRKSEHRQTRSYRDSRSLSPKTRESRSPSPRARESFYEEVYGAASRSPRTDSSGDDRTDGDIKEKLSELSNPVPYDIEHERKVRFLVSETATGKDERRNIYVGGIERFTTKAELAERFHRFGHIEKITLHFRQRGDNYAFIIFEEPESAKRAIEEGNDDPKYPSLELCFGGRRKFVGGSYVDFDGNNSYLEEGEFGSKKVRDSPENDFDQLLKMALQSRPIKTEPEWS